MVTLYGMEVSGFQSLWGRGSFLVSIPAQILAQPRLQRVSETYPRGKTAGTCCCPPIPIYTELRLHIPIHLLCSVCKKRYVTGLFFAFTKEVATCVSEVYFKNRLQFLTLGQIMLG